MTNEKNKNETELKAVQAVTGLKVSIYESGDVVYNGVTKYRAGGVSLSRNGQFQLKLSGVESLFLANFLKDNIDYINDKIAVPELKSLTIKKD